MVPFHLVTRWSGCSLYLIEGTLEQVPGPNSTANN